ncbi:hypothetical protein PPERSA_04591 [Pseudocohnilembus persalinus]|uniref:PUB domain-containing protein n=1 Tax=Pseudocohnilembus persalinus TaxID=266149 RepID=A0A0V0QAG1_PSEPJ|nr:hypothetical protein PPERSA_04591 [Pseudocohnilembus persalinus]|eukprot:KRW99229.1 hypothetical protein PPERSA_04591 [Pseudocohnilembus persalinus]
MDLEEKAYSYLPKQGLQIGSKNPVEIELMHLIDFNIPNQKTYDGLILLEKIIQNILSHPQEKKYQQLKLDNKKLSEYLFSLNNSKQLLTTIGFIDIENVYQIWDLTDDIIDNLRIASRSLKQYITSFQILQEGDPKLNKMVQEKKKAYEEKLAYKKQILEQFEKNKQQNLKEHKDGSKQKLYEQKPEKQSQNQINHNQNNTINNQNIQNQNTNNYYGNQKYKEQ